jgi:hypothetical protein
MQFLQLVILNGIGFHVPKQSVRQLPFVHGIQTYGMMTYLMHLGPEIVTGSGASDGTTVTLSNVTGLKVTGKNLPGNSTLSINLVLDSVLY